mmetsp:Transcript_121607/g.339381  ORF Transcript_121607/g.339381 Transcript_121607/m.339381 type:complete len:207 (+) Transcript_121607:155-775(+)
MAAWAARRPLTFFTASLPEPAACFPASSACKLCRHSASLAVRDSSTVSLVTNRQMVTWRCCPKRTHLPMACCSKTTARSGVAAAMGCTSSTWLAVVRFVPDADISRESSRTRCFPERCWKPSRMAVCSNMSFADDRRAWSMPWSRRALEMSRSKSANWQKTTARSWPGPAKMPLSACAMRASLLPCCSLSLEMSCFMALALANSAM